MSLPAPGGVPQGFGVSHEGKSGFLHGVATIGHSGFWHAAPGLGRGIRALSVGSRQNPSFAFVFLRGADRVADVILRPNV